MRVQVRLERENGQRRHGLPASKHLPGGKKNKQREQHAHQRSSEACGYHNTVDAVLDEEGATVTKGIELGGEFRTTFPWWFGEFAEIEWRRCEQLQQRRMFGIDAEIAALPMSIAGENMIRLVNRRACACRVINKLERECGQ